MAWNAHCLSATDDCTTRSAWTWPMVVNDLSPAARNRWFLAGLHRGAEVLPKGAAIAAVSRTLPVPRCPLLRARDRGASRRDAPHEYDLSATGVGVVEADAVLRPARCQVG